MMGLSNWLHWLAWFVKYFLNLSVSGLLMFALFKVRVRIIALMLLRNIAEIFHLLKCA